MKKLILFCLLCFTTSCAVVIDTPLEYVSVYNGDEHVIDMPIFKCDHQGHSYIIFGAGSSSTFVHDPECSCHKNK